MRLPCGKRLWQLLQFIKTQTMTAAPTQPKIALESTEWLEYRAFHAELNDLPRVLLIGDSISGGYLNGVAQGLEGQAYVTRLGSSKPVSLPAYFDEVRLALSQHSYAIIHFNNGLHGWDYTEEEYAQGLAKLVDYLKANAPQAKLIWASSTQMRTEAPDFAGFEPRNERVKVRNQMAAQQMAQAGIPINDLYALMEPNHALLCDGVHYQAEGNELLVAQVLAFIRQAL